VNVVEIPNATKIRCDETENILLRVKKISKRSAELLNMCKSSVFLPSRCDYHADDGRCCDCKRIVTFKCLWHKYGEMVATELESFWCSTTKSCQKLSTKALSVLVPFAITYLGESGFSSLLHLQNKYRNHLNPSKDLRVALGQWRTQNIFMGGVHSVAYGVICIWCALFVTS